MFAVYLVFADHFSRKDGNIKVAGMFEVWKVGNAIYF